MNFTKIYREADKGVTGSPPIAESKNTDSGEHMIPKSRLDQEIARAKEAEARLAALEQERKTENEKRLEEQERWKELAEDRAQKLAEAERKAAKADEYEADMAAYIKEMEEKIPENMKGLIPDGAIEQRFRWIKRNQDFLLKPAAPTTAAGVRGSGQVTEPAPQELKVLASQFGLNKEQADRAAQRYAEKNKQS
jgi:beta-glucosidase-like glycosyl hydrolase